MMSNDESEHNDERVSPLVNKGEPHFANKHIIQTRFSHFILFFLPMFQPITILYSFKRSCDLPPSKASSLEGLTTEKSSLDLKCAYLRAA
jgi:hypothetical protein